MTYREVLSQRIVAISTSESPDMATLGLTAGHLRDAMAEIARHLLALGARLAYGGDLRPNGFTELLFELVARHGRDADLGDERTSVVNYLAWPIHIRLPRTELDEYASSLVGSAGLVLLSLDGSRWTTSKGSLAATVEPTQAEWAQGLTAMRRVMRDETWARVVLGGRVEDYDGDMPGIAEESFLSLQIRQPLFIMAGFGGCARDIAETLGLISPWPVSRPRWKGREEFKAFQSTDLSNGLTPEENAILVQTPHVDQAVTLILRGLFRLSGADSAPR